ncbi:MAG: hormogonium polysaccharide biosynthesis glycosyltransferase HpsE [Phormidium tanganyikae FI6-MK23]|jgi:glycosyltransferase involved in cell wall biosynthesis|nr:hormogonium polysaccharide biosynthesis glycosyltransferase HpsE [Phormidium tanganyikae FI6-MK23]
MDLSVVICTYNGEARIGQVLDRVRSQIHTDPIAWEVLVIDNNSRDNTKQIVSNCADVRYVFEAEQGLAFARSRAIREAAGQWVAFLDDDTLPDQNWVAQAYQFAQAHPEIGAFGGQIHAEYEVEPPVGIKKLAPYLAIVERGSKPHKYDRVLPPGAGLVVQRQVWLDAVPEKLVLVGRTTAAMLASEDIEAILHIQNSGREIWYNPEMHLYHQIPHWRTERSYLLKLVKGVGLARHHIRMTRWKAWQRPIVTIAYLTNDLRKLFAHWVKSRNSQSLEVVCEQQLLVSSLVSPFYLGSLKQKA